MAKKVIKNAVEETFEIPENKEVPFEDKEETTNQPETLLVEFLKTLANPEGTFSQGRKVQLPFVRAKELEEAKIVRIL